MSKRPRIKQADGSLLDLPLDAETIKGKTLEEIALKADIPTKTSELTNDSNFLTKHQDISGKADKTELKNYLPLSGAKKMTGDLDMDDYMIKNVNTIGVDGRITTATKLLVHDENDDIIPNHGSNYNASYYYASGIKFTTAQEQSKYNLYYPKETGTFVVRDDAGGVKSITKIIDPYDNNGIVFGLLNDETTLYNPDSTIGLSSTKMINGGDTIHSLKFPDTSEATGDGSWKTYTWNLPKKSGTIVLGDDIPTKTSQLENDSNYATKENTGATLDVSINNTTYVMTLKLCNSYGSVISTGTVDLPLETMVISARYADGKLYLTTKDGNELEGIDISNIVSGLVPNTRTVNGKALSSDIVLNKADVGLGNVNNVAITSSQVSQITTNKNNIASLKARIEALESAPRSSGTVYNDYY